MNTDGEPTTDQGNKTEVQLGKPMIVLGLFAGVLIRDYLQEHG